MAGGKTELFDNFSLSNNFILKTHFCRALARKNAKTVREPSYHRTGGSRFVGSRTSQILFLCLFFVFSQVYAQHPAQLPAEEDVFRYPLSSATMPAFNATCVNLAKKPVVKGNFVQEKFLSRFNRSLNSSGNFIIAAEQGMVWETLQPFPSAMIMGRDFIIQSRPDGQKSVLGAQGNETFTQMADVISSVFSGQIQRLLENFAVHFSGSVSNWNMGLIPRDSIFASFVTRITMSGDSVIRSIILFESSGDIITYTLSNQSFPERLNDHEKAFFTIQ